MQLNHTTPTPRQVRRMNDAYLDRSRNWNRQNWNRRQTRLQHRVEPTTTDLWWLCLVMALIGCLMAA